MLNEGCNIFLLVFFDILIFWETSFRIFIQRKSYFIQMKQNKCF